MIDRIDHTAESQRILDHMLSVCETDENTTALLYAQAAQVHAMLALVEQQRIANVIALAESGRTTVSGARSALAGLYDGSLDEGTTRMTLRSDIKEALGL